MLEAENSAWATGKYTVSPRSKKSKHSRASQRVLVTLPEVSFSLSPVGVPLGSYLLLVSAHRR